MALQAARLLLLLGGGFAATIIAQNGHLTEFMWDMTKVISKHVKEADPPKFDRRQIEEQLGRLKQEVGFLLSERNVTIVNGSDTTSMNWTAVSTTAVVGVVGYGYMRWKGMTFSGIMYVTKTQMAEAVSGVSKQFDQVSTNLAAARRHLTFRIDSVNKTLEESAETQRVIQNEVFGIKDEVSKCGGDVQSVQQMVQELEEKIDQVNTNQSLTIEGIRYLCQKVPGLKVKQTPEIEGQKPALYLPSSVDASLADASSMEDTSSSSTSSLSSFPDALSNGLKELAENLEAGSNKATVVPTVVPERLFDFKRLFSFGS